VRLGSRWPKMAAPGLSRHPPAGRRCARLKPGPCVQCHARPPPQRDPRRL